MNIYIKKHHLKGWHKIGIGAIALASAGYGAIKIMAPNPVAIPSNPPSQEQSGIGFKQMYPYLYPDPIKTPGAINPNITQDNIRENICNSSWSTRSIRPPVSYTTALKIKELNSGYNYQRDTNPVDYELDHFISLEIGGDPTSEQNLWPEPYNTQVNGQIIGAHQKDTVENILHKEICDGQITLAQAQIIIMTDWYSCYLSIKVGASCK